MTNMTIEREDYKEFQEAKRILDERQTMKQLLVEFEKIRYLELKREESIKRFVKIWRDTGSNYLVSVAMMLGLSKTDGRAKALIAWMGNFGGDLWEY